MEQQPLICYSLNNLKTRINRCLTNTPDIVNERPSKQSRIFSIPLHYKNIKVIQEGDKFSLKLTSGTSPEIRETDFTNQDLQTVAFKNVDGSTALIVLNQTDKKITYSVKYNGSVVEVTINEHSINTVLL